MFHEASWLRTEPSFEDHPAIVTQLARYRATLTEQAAEQLAESYPALCRDLVRLDALRGTVRAARGLAAVRPLIRWWTRSPTAARRLRVDTKPRLVVFGFDTDKRDGALKAVIDELRGQHELRVYAVGRPGGRTTAAFRRPPTWPDGTHPGRVRPPAAAGICVRR